MSKYAFSEQRLNRALDFINLLFAACDENAWEETDWEEELYPKVSWKDGKPILEVKFHNYEEFVDLILENEEDYPQISAIKSSERADQIGIICEQLREIKVWKPVGNINRHAGSVKTFHALVQSKDISEVRSFISGLWQSHRPKAHVDWGGAPLNSRFFGRENELELLRLSITEQKCKVAIITGIAGQGKSATAAWFLKGGNGKTDLALKFAQIVSSEFEYIIWRSLKNYPRCTSTLSDLIKFISDQRTIDLKENSDAQRKQLLDLLARKRCLVILDNAETVINNPDYLALFNEIASSNHKSCLLLTTREIPKGLDLSVHKNSRNLVTILDLQGVDWKTGKKIVLQYSKKAKGSDTEWEEFIETALKGNPLALELAGIYLQNNCNGVITEFLKEPRKDFAELRQYLLDSLFKGLSPDEKRVVFWLAINRGPVSIEELRKDFPYIDAQIEKALAVVISADSPKLPIERSELGFSLQEVLMEYFTEQFIEIICKEIKNNSNPSSIDYFDTYWMMKATTHDYLREAQVRFIIRPILRRLEEQLGSKSAVYDHLIRILDSFKTWRSSFPESISGYLAGNLINMIICLKDGEKLYGIDFSGLPVWQAYLPEATLHSLNFSGADLSRSVFRQILGGALSIAVSADGELLAVGDARNDIHIWRTSDYQKCGICKGHTDWVRSIAISDDRTILISGSEDQTVRLWDITDPFDDEEEVPLLDTFSDCGGKVWSVAVSPNNKYVACGSDDGTVRLWNRETSTLLFTRDGHKKRIRSITFHPNNTLMTSSGEDGVIKVWDIPTRRCQQDLQAYPESENDNYKVGCVLFSPDGTKLASGDSENNVKLWDIQSGECIQVLQGHSNSVVSLTFSSDSRLLASSGWDATIRVWEVDSVDSSISLKTLGGSANTDTSLGHKKRVTSIAFTPSDRTIVSCSEDETVRVWNVEQGQCIQTFRGYSNWFMSVAFLPSAPNILASGSNDGGIRLWDINTCECVGILGEAEGLLDPDTFNGPLSHSERVWCLDISAITNRLVSGSDDNTVKLWDISTIHQPKYLQTFFGRKGRRISSVALSTDGQTLAACDHDHNVSLWNIETRELKVRQKLADLPWSVAAHPTETVFATGGNDEVVNLWNIDGTCIGSLSGHSERIRCVAFSHNGHLIASCCDGHTVRIWNYQTRECLHVLAEHTREVMSVIFSPDDRLVASAGYDAIVIVWDVDTGKAIHMLKGHTDMLWGLSFSSDGKKLASCGQDETIRVWDLTADRRTINQPKILRVKKPYEGINLTGVKGLLPTQRKELIQLGAWEDPSCA